MSFICPPKHLPLWKEIVDKYGEDNAMLAFLKNAMNIPNDMAHAERLIKENKSMLMSVHDIKDKLKDSLTIQMKIYEKRVGGKKYAEEIKDIINKIDANESLAAIMEMVSIANKYTSEALVRAKVLQEKVNIGLDKLSDPEKQEIADTLLEIKQFMSAYSILEDAELFFNEDTAPAKQLALAMSNRRNTIRIYKQVHEEILADWLSKEADRVNKSLDAKGKSEYRISKEQIKKLLNTAVSDISVFEELFGAQANSKDPLTGLVASTIKSMAYEAHLKDYENEQSLSEAYEKSTRDKSSIVGFNREYLRQAEVYEFVPELDEKGNPKYDERGRRLGDYKYVKRRALHTEYLEDQFDKDRRKTRDALKESGIADEQTIIREMHRWYTRNTVLGNVQQIEDRQRAALSPIEFKRWKESNLKRVTLSTYPNGTTTLDYVDKNRIAKQTDEHIYLYTGDYIKPADKYLNPDFKKLQGDNYFVKLHDLYQTSNSQYHGVHQLKFGVIPQIRKEGLKGQLREGSIDFRDAASNFKDSFNVTAYDSNYGIQRPDGSIYKEVPSLFTMMIDEDDLSLDLYRSVLMFSQASNRFKAMSDVQPYIELLTDAIKGNQDLQIPMRKVIDTTASGNAIINAVTGKYQTKSGDRVNSALMEFIDKIVYDQRELEAAFSFMSKDFSLNKITAKAMSYGSMTTLAFNLSTGISNELFGQYQVALEAAVGEHFSKSDYAKAQQIYMTAIPTLVGDIAAGYPKSKIGKLAVIYDAMQGEHADEYGKKVTQGNFGKIFSQNSLFFLQKSGEHHIQVASMIAMMQATKVKTKSGGEINLYDAYDENGRLIPEAQWTKEDQFAFMQKLHKLNKSLHGIHNKFDSPTIQRKWYGKLIMMFRKYIYTGMERRFSRKYLDIEAGDTYEGYFRIFFSKLSDAIKAGKLSLMLNSNLTQDEKRAMYKAYTDVAVSIAMYIIFSTLKAAAGDDDEENSWLTNQAILQSRRFSGDIMMYINPLELFKLTRTPSAMYGTMDNLANAAAQLGDPFATYERKSGTNERGDLKILHKWGKVIPAFSGLNKSLNPGSQVQFYNSFF
jgi:hypothetical protein